MKKFILMLCLSFFVFSCGMDDEDPESTFNKLMAYSYSEDYVKKMLKDPESAEFASSEGKLAHTKHLGNWEYEVTSFVVSKNSFNANVKTAFYCRLIFDKEKDLVKLVKINVGR